MPRNSTASRDSIVLHFFNEPVSPLIQHMENYSIWKGRWPYADIMS